MRFDSYHPAIHFIYFFSVIAAAIIFNHPVFVLLSYTCAFCYSVTLNGKKAVVFNLLLIGFILIFALFYASYHHFGVTNLAVNMIGNQITLEALIYGAVIGVKCASVFMWFSCVHTIVSSDKVIYLFGRILPRLSLFLSILLRMVPHIKERALKVHTAQKCIGRGSRQQKGVLSNIRSFIRVVSIVITWTMENFVETSDSMRSRGYLLKGRTSFSIYRFDNRDRSFVIVLFLCLTMIGAGVLLDQTHILYIPEIVINRITPASGVFYTAYALLCFLPMILQVIGEYRFKRLNG